MKLVNGLGNGQTRGAGVRRSVPLVDVYTLGGVEKITASIGFKVARIASDTYLIGMNSTYFLLILITSLTLISAPFVSALTINNQPLPSPLTLAGHYESSSHTHPLRNGNKIWIGELSYSWLNNPTNQSILDGGIWTSGNGFGASDGWLNLGSNGNQFTVKSRWETAFSNSFSFSVPSNNALAYSIIIHDIAYTEITKWSELGKLSYDGGTTFHDYHETGTGAQLESTSTYGVNNVRYNLEAGGIYSVFQDSSQGGTHHTAQDSNYSIVVESVPEPSTYALLIGCLALSSIILRPRIKA